MLGERTVGSDCEKFGSPGLLNYENFACGFLVAWVSYSAAFSAPSVRFCPSLQSLTLFLSLHLHC